MVKIENLEIKARDALLDCLQDIPFLQVMNATLQPEYGGDRTDLRVILKLNGEIRNIIAEIKRNGELRYARQAVNQLLRYLQYSPGTYGVFIAPYISSGAAKLCLEEGIGYVDLAGNCHISFETIYIHKEGKANPFTRKRYLRSLFSPKAERVLRVLLSTGLKEWKVEELAFEAQVSFGQVANVKRLLAEQEWIDAKAIGFSIVKPFDLIEEWSQNYRFNRNKVWDFYSLLSSTDFEYKLADLFQQERIPYGLTGFSGSARYAPTVRHQRVMAYVQDDIERWFDLLAIKPVDSGANVTIMKPYDEGVLYGNQDFEGIAVVSPIQNYLDLCSLKGRGEEAAQALFDKVIKNIW